MRFFLDEKVYSDAARALLPEVAGYAAGMVEHLLRGGLALAAEGGRRGGHAWKARPAGRPTAACSCSPRTPAAAAAR